ncbi:TonB family C-terminal domain-containing protein [Pseudoxanthomonas sp. GM95]|uniref:TonB family protein n=1 Tax=Pseudoxanthomonas sp. GM95 TaxID=1881043 RepID=UPI0008CD8FDE|nr:TonB family protein [Pseudoxanthomonas sp. GM95]SEM38942.1 TonB family C-terminal domain-containing protein [Pseudoxanthomonas sp. GM95]
MARIWHMGAWVVALSMLTAGAQAQTASAVRKTIEASMLVSGDIEITPQGKVETYRFDHPEDLPPEARQLLDQAIPSWVFHPVERDGHAVGARSKMSLRLVARKLDNDRYEMAVRSAQFEGDPQPGEVVGSAKMTPPRYPQTAAQNGVAGDVYLLVRVGRDGTVEDVAAEQTNLQVVDRERNMEKWRAMFEKSAMDAARGWTFVPPTRGESVGDAYWQVRVPVSYSMGEPRKLEEVKWRAYVPGPRNLIPWAKPNVAADTGVDAGIDGHVSQVGAGLQLKTPLGAS